MIEWTGYVFNTGLALLFWFYKNLFSTKKMAVYICLATALAAFCTVLHYSLVLGFEPSISMLWERFFVRSALSQTDKMRYIDGFQLSYGIYALSLVAIFFLLYSKKLPKVAWFILVAACIPMLENLLMLQHATKFSYDRLKFIIPAAIAIAFLFAQWPSKGQIALVILVSVASISGITSYHQNMMYYAPWTSIDAKNRIFASKLLKKLDSKCTIFGSNIGVRGYANLLFHHGIYEYITPSQLADLSKQRKACASVYLEGKWVAMDLQQYTKATIISKSGRQIIVSE